MFARLGKIKAAINRREGYSLIELLIVTVITGIGGLAVVSLLGGVMDNSAMNNAKLVAAGFNKLLLRTIQRDWEARDLTKGAASLNLTLCTSLNSFCRSLRIERAKIALESNYMVTYRSVCSSSTGDSMSATVLSGFDFAAIASKTSCYKAMKCGSGSYPRVEINVGINETGIPDYPVKKFPEQLTLSEGGGVRSRPVGYALCSSFDPGSNNLRLTIETFYVKKRKGGSSGYELAFGSRDLMLSPRSNGNSLQILGTSVEMK